MVSKRCVWHGNYTPDVSPVVKSKVSIHEHKCHQWHECCGNIELLVTFGGRTVCTACIFNRKKTRIDAKKVQMFYLYYYYYHFFYPDQTLLIAINKLLVELWLDIWLFFQVKFVEFSPAYTYVYSIHIFYRLVVKTLFFGVNCPVWTPSCVLVLISLLMVWGYTEEFLVMSMRQSHWELNRPRVWYDLHPA